MRGRLGKKKAFTFFKLLVYLFNHPQPCRSSHPLTLSLMLDNVAFVQMWRKYNKTMWVNKCAYCISFDIFITSIKHTQLSEDIILCDSGPLKHCDKIIFITRITVTSVSYKM